MREGWGWGTRGSLSSLGDAGVVGGASIVTVGKGGGLGVGDTRVIIAVDTGGGVVGWVMVVSSMQVVGSW